MTACGGMRDDIESATNHIEIGQDYGKPVTITLLFAIVFCALCPAHGSRRLWQRWTLRGDEGAWSKALAFLGRGASALRSLAYWLGMLRKTQRTSSICSARMQGRMCGVRIPRFD